MNKYIIGGNSGIERKWGGTQAYNQQATRRQLFRNLRGKDGKTPKLSLNGTRCDDRNYIHLTQDRGQWLATETSVPL